MTLNDAAKSTAHVGVHHPASGTEWNKTEQYNQTYLTLPSNRGCLAWNELRRPQSILRNLRGIPQGASEPIWHREREGYVAPRIGSGPEWSEWRAPPPQIATDCCAPLAMTGAASHSPQVNGAWPGTSYGDGLNSSQSAGDSTPLTRSS